MNKPYRDPTIPGGGIEPGAPPTGPQTLDEVAAFALNAEDERKKLHSLVLAKLGAVMSMFGVAETARLLDVHVDTLHAWNNGEHVPRNLRKLDIVLGWAMCGRNVWDRALVFFMSECGREPDERRREDILRALALSVAMILRQHGYSYEYRARPQNRASLQITAPNLPKCKVLLSFLDRRPYGRVYIPGWGDQAFVPDSVGVLALLDKLRERQEAEQVRQLRESSLQALDKKISEA